MVGGFKLVIAAFVFFLLCNRPNSSWDWVNELRRPDGSALRVAELRGKSSLLVFWSSWSSPCFPLLEEMRSLEEKVRVIAVQVDAREFRGDRDWGGLDIVVARDESMIKRFEIAVLPTVLLLDRSGKVVGRFEGYSPKVCGRIEEQIRAVSEMRNAS